VAEDVDPAVLLKRISKSKLSKGNLKDNDHRIIGQKLDLFSFYDVAPGMAFWHPKGLVIRNELIELWRMVHRKAGYQEIKTPQVMSDVLWKVSGHWAHYKDNIFLTAYDDRPFVVKPMNCPGGILVFSSRERSYEGAAAAHRPSVGEYDRVGWTPEPSTYEINEGDGAFYGPKIDFKIRDSLDREWQTATIQLDFQMPERFQIKYVGEDGKDHAPIMLHRTVYGSLERFMGILLEHLNGNLPTWLAPVQARVISFKNNNAESAKKVYDQLFELGYRVELDLSYGTVEGKIRDAELQKIPYIIVIGDKEEENGTLAVRQHGAKAPKYGVKFEDFAAQLKAETDLRARF